MKLRTKIASSALVTSALAAGIGLSFGTPASASGRPRVLTAGVVSLVEGRWGPVLVDRGHFTLYMLTDEVGGRISPCTQANTCWLYWKPLRITKGTKIFVGAAVKGKVSTVSLSSTTAQVMFNSYPVYTYIGDSKAAQQHGEGINSFGGTWYMLRPSATTAAGTPVK